MSVPSRLARVTRLLRTGALAEALHAAQSITEDVPGVAGGWLALAHANHGLGRQVAADAALDRAVQRGARGDDVDLLRALVDHKLGRSERALSRLRPLAAGSGALALNAAFALAETLHRAGRMEELRDLVAAGGAWLDDPRAVLARARVTATTDPRAAAAALETVARGDQPARERRVAGFEAVRMMDAAGEYRCAFDLAMHLHATTTEPFDLAGLLGNARRQVELLRGPADWCQPCAPAVRGVAIVVGMPRSGTTLLEQMLDRHPLISGIGEYEGILALGNGVVAEGRWPDGIGALAPARARDLQREYLQGAAVLRRPGARVHLDKTLHAWQWLPAVAALLPGAVCLRIERDARDTAISLFLSNFHRQAFGWTGSVDSIRQVIGAERELAPLALEALGIPHESIRYEDLVADPRAYMERILARLGLPMDERVLAPEQNKRTVLTLSHEQVRRSINASSVGRWRNYAFAFGPEWG